MSKKVHKVCSLSTDKTKCSAVDKIKNALNILIAIEMTVMQFKNVDIFILIPIIMKDVSKLDLQMNVL